MTYAALAAAGVPISLVIPYDDVCEEVYTWVIELPVAAISLDFCGVPGAAAGNNTAQLIAKHGFPKVKLTATVHSIFTCTCNLLLVSIIILDCSLLLSFLVGQASRCWRH